MTTDKAIEIAIESLNREFHFEYDEEKHSELATAIGVLERLKSEQNSNNSARTM